MQKSLTKFGKANPAIYKEPNASCGSRPIPGMQGLVYQKPNNVIHATNRLENKNHLSQLVQGKNLTKFNTHSRKNFKKSGVQNNFLNLIECRYKKLTSNVILKGEIANTFSLILGTE